MKFGQLTEYNMGNIVVKKSYTKCAGSEPYLKNQYWAYLWNNSAVLKSLFLLYANVRTIEI